LTGRGVVVVVLVQGNRGDVWKGEREKAPEVQPELAA
jgi:hypothetical protein